VPSSSSSFTDLQVYAKNDASSKPVPEPTVRPADSPDAEGEARLVKLSRQRPLMPPPPVEETSAFDKTEVADEEDGSRTLKSSPLRDEER